MLFVEQDVMNKIVINLLCARHLVVCPRFILTFMPLHTLLKLVCLLVLQVWASWELESFHLSEVVCNL